MRFLPVGITFRDGLLALGTGLLGAAAFPPIGLWPLSLASICLFLGQLRDRNSRDARNIGLIYGLVYGAGTLYWFFGIFGALAVSLTALFAGYFGLLATLIAMTRDHRPVIRALLVALFAVAVEWVRGDAWYLRFPWYTAPHALAMATPCIAASRWLGTYGLSFIIWFVAGAGAYSHMRYWVAFLLLPACSFLLPAVEPPDRRALLIQTEEIGGVEFIIPEVLEEKVDLAVLPEYAYFVSPKRALESKRGPAMLAGKTSSAVVFGAVEGMYGEPDFKNVAVVIDADGRILGMFQKQRPIPLFRDGLPGTDRPVFPVEEGILGVGVCYDFDAPAIASSLVRKGATVLVVPTYNAMTWSRTQHVHHELLLRLRAVENDRWILRAASSGRSEAISPDGKPSEEGIAIGEQGFITVRYGHRHSRPLGGYTALLGPASAGGTVLFLLISAVQGWRKRRKEPPQRPAQEPVRR